MKLISSVRLMLLFGGFVSQAYAESTGSILVDANHEGAAGGSFQIQYVDHATRETVSIIATTPITITGISKDTSYTIDAIQPAVNGNAFLGTPITGIIPHNGKTVTNTLIYAGAPQDVAPVRPPALSISRNLNGSARLDCTGSAGRTICIQATDNLSATWTTISTNACVGDNMISVIDHDAANYPTRFYRAVITQ